MDATRLFLVFCTFFVGMTSNISAWVGSDQAKWGFQGELLYFTPSFDDTYYILIGSVDNGAGDLIPKGRRMNNPLSYDLGFRVEGVYRFCNPCVELRGRWTHLYTTRSESCSNLETPSQLWPVQVVPSQTTLSQPYAGSASSHIGVMYQKGEILFDERAWSFCFGSLSFREGIEWAYLRYHEVIDYAEVAGPQEHIRHHSHTKGIGPQLGVILFCEPHYLFPKHPKCVSYRILATGALIAANSKSKLVTTSINGINGPVSQQSFWRIVPECVFRFALNYAPCLRRCHPSFECGYEITTYIRGTSKLVFTDQANPGVSSNQYSDFYVHGFFLGFGINY